MKTEEWGSPHSSVQRIIVNFQFILYHIQSPFSTYTSVKGMSKSSGGSQDLICSTTLLQAVMILVALPAYAASRLLPHVVLHFAHAFKTRTVDFAQASRPNNRADRDIPIRFS